MNQKIFNVLMFATGAAIGSLVTWKVVKTRYERIAQEEIDSVKETWARLEKTNRKDNAPYEYDDEDEQEDTEDEDDYDEEFEPSVLIDYASLAGKYKQSSDVTVENDEKGEGEYEVPYINGPYVIAPEDFGDGKYDHELHCLTYYADDVLADDWWVKLDIDETIGEDSLKHFGEYTEDIVHVRNERLNADYEVVRDCRTYAEVTASNPLSPVYED